MSGIHQFVPVLHAGDAVGRHTMALRDAIGARGFESRIYVDAVDAGTATETFPVVDYPARAGEVKGEASHDNPSARGGSHARRIPCPW